MRTGMIGNRFANGLVIALAVWTGVARCDESLDTLRTDVREARPDPPDAPDPSPRRDDDCDDDPWDDDCDDYDATDVLGIGALIGIGLTSPFWGPPIVLGDTYDRSGYFPTYPHQFDCGYMVIGEESRYDHGFDCSGRCAARLASDFGTNLSGIDWLGTRVLVETTPRLGLDADFRLLSEERFPRANDHLWLGDANLLFRFAQDEMVQMRTGVGFNYLSDDYDTNFGFNFTYGGDWYFVKPWVLSAEMDLGWLGEATVVHLRGTVGANWRFAEAYIGYDFYDIGRAQVGGMVAGVRLWF